MKLENRIKFGIIILFLVFTLSFVSSAMRSTPQYAQFMGGQTREFDKSMCEQGQDFLIQIAPFGCTPAVVRSDLLEEQNVPVFCQLGATKINPLIDVEAIESISFSGEYPPEVEGIAFHPARAALGVGGNLNNPVLNNIGYVVVVLKKQANSSAMPDFVSGNLTARVRYDVKNAFGIGKANFYLPEMTDNEWEIKKSQYSFWEGKGTLRAEEIGTDRAVISVYSNDNKISSVSLDKGETSKKIYLPGFDCLASLQVKLNSLENPDTRALLRINANVVEVAEGEKFLENNCQIVGKPKKQGLVQKVKIRCREDEGVNSFNLMIGPKVRLDINGEEREVGLGDFLYKKQNEKKSVYVGYIGTNGKSGNVEDLFVYLVSMPKHKDSLSEDELARYNNLVGELLDGDFKGGIVDDTSNLIEASAGASNLLFNFIVRGEGFYWINYGKEEDAFDSQVIVNGFADPQNSDIIKKIDNYQNAVNDYETIEESFSGEKHPKINKLTLDEEALYQKINLAWNTQQKFTALELCGEFKSSYPNSKKEIGTYCDDYKLSSQEISVAYVTINGESKKITFDGIYEPSIKDYSARIFVSNAGKYDGEKTLRKNGKGYVSDNESIVLKKLEKDYAVFDVSDINYGILKEITYDPKNLKIELGDYKIVGENNYKISLEKINLRASAKVSLSPGFENTGTEANFGFKIGIEKRTFELSPNQIKKQIEILDEQLGKWQDLSEGLGGVVKGLKTACLATGAGLVFKNFLANTGGAGIARKFVMRGKGGWYERCVDIASDSGISIDKCLLENADEIDKDVDTVTRIIEEQNKETATSTVEIFDGVFSNSIFADPDGNGDNINKEDIKEILSNTDNYNEQQSKEIRLWTKVLENDDVSSSSKEMAKKELYSTLLDVQTTAGNYVERKNFASETGMGSSSLVASFGEINKIPITERMEFQANKYTSNEIKVDDYVFSFKESNRGEEYLLVYDEDGVVQNTYTIGKKDVLTKTEEKNPLDFVFQKYDRSSYENEYKNAKLRYYETDPYKGLPAIVPFNLKNGWYAATKQTLPVLGNIASYEKSGAVSSFWLCNVGENNLEENIGGDDICQMINLGTGQSYDQFPGLDEKEASTIIRNAEQAVSQASRAYRSGLSGRVKILGESIEVGKPAVNLPEIECADLMSPKDCQLLFNVCDPVICPSSRCDLGGAYPVRDVIQTGIIGSLTLCLPNAQEGILMPVCLTGVQAGIDGWLSITNSYKDCLQNALDTGEMIGICDEMYSIYMCEFFWRQALPLADIAIPRIIGALVGQGARGGGEYLSVDNAWNTAKNSVTYFTQYYGANANKAFNARTTEEVGTAVCKLSVSAVYANGVDIIDSLTEPDSPSQFMGRFDEIPFSSVTVPPTSHYKVFYHIFAGKDSGAYYKVYLKGIPESSYYQDTSPTLSIASGYIETGGYSSETKDLTAVSGYKQLCISVNGQEECGFKEVTTSFALDYISDKYVASQIEETNIKTEKECVSGSASAYSLLNPSVQGAAEEIVNPAIYNKGIIRTCATNNPGEGSDPYAETENSRWKQVGYCGSENIKCWIDTENIKDIIEVTSVGDEALESVTQNHLDILRNKGGYLSKGKFASEVKGINDETDNAKKLTLIDDIFDKVFLNSEKAYLYLLRGNAYAELATKAIKRKMNEAKVVGDEKETNSAKTYEIDRIGFKYNGKIEFGEDVEKWGDSKVELIVEYEENCEKVEYQIFSKRLLQFIRGGKLEATGETIESINTILNKLPIETYYVRGSCFDEEEKATKKKSNDLIIKSLPENTEGLPSVYERYNKLNEIFEKYADENLPRGWNPNKFKALLVSIADRQTNLGYPAPEFKYNPEWLMEYGWEGGERLPEYSGAEQQVEKASLVLKLALEEQKNFEPYYSKCKSKIGENALFICVLSVYYTGEKSRFFGSNRGEDYAKETIEIMKFWKEYFDSESRQDIRDTSLD